MLIYQRVSTFSDSVCIHGEFISAQKSQHIMLQVKLLLAKRMEAQEVEETRAKQGQVTGEINVIFST